MILSSPLAVTTQVPSLMTARDHPGQIESRHMSAYSHCSYRSKCGPLGHRGNATSPDLLGHSGDLCCRVAVLFPDRCIALRNYDSNFHLTGFGCSFEFHSIAGQLFQNPGQQSGINGQGVILLGGDNRSVAMSITWVWKGLTSLITTVSTTGT